MLRRPPLREALLAAVGDVDRVVLLGDTLELRSGPMGEAVTASRAFFADLGAVLGDRELVLVPGNHDHALIGRWLARRSLEPGPPPLGLEHRIAPTEASDAVAVIAGWLGPGRFSVAYPGLWLSPDVYATHGHYLDCHLTVPTFERLGAGMMGRALRRPAQAIGDPDAYEAILSPIYAWIHAIAQSTGGARALTGQSSIEVWRALSGRGSRRLRSRLLAGALPLGVAMLSRAGLGPLGADLSRAELRRAGLRAMGEVVTRLGIDARHVVFGHTHRAGPLAEDDLDEWQTPSGTALLNTGSWVYERHFLTPAVGQSPYWPGVCAVVEGSGGPRLARLLSDRSHSELAGLSPA